MLIALIVGLLSRVGSHGALSGVAVFADLLLGGVCVLQACAIWVQQSSLGGRWRAATSVLRLDRLIGAAWQGWVLLLIVSALALPWMLIRLLDIFVLPQLEQSAQHGGAPLTAALRLIADLGSEVGGGGALSAIAIVGSIYALLALGRYVRLILLAAH